MNNLFKILIKKKKEVITLLRIDIEYNLRKFLLFL